MECFNESTFLDEIRCNIIQLRDAYCRRLPYVLFIDDNVYFFGGGKKRIIAN